MAAPEYVTVLSTRERAQPSAQRDAKRAAPMFTRGSPVRETPGGSRNRTAAVRVLTPDDAVATTDYIDDALLPPMGTLNAAHKFLVADHAAPRRRVAVAAGGAIPLPHKGVRRVYEIRSDGRLHHRTVETSLRTGLPVHVLSSAPGTPLLAAHVNLGDALLHAACEVAVPTSAGIDADGLGPAQDTLDTLLDPALPETTDDDDDDKTLLDLLCAIDEAIEERARAGRHGSDEVGGVQGELDGLAAGGADGVVDFLRAFEGQPQVNNAGECDLRRLLQATYDTWVSYNNTVIGTSHATAAGGTVAARHHT